MDSQIETNETIGAEDFEIFVTELARIGRIAERYNRRNAQIAELERAEHPSWPWATSHQAEAIFERMESYGDITLFYEDRYYDERESYTILRADLTDPDFEARAKIRIAELTAARAAEAALRDQAAAELAGKRAIEEETKERVLFSRLRDKYEGAEPTEETGQR
jgi:hypothetical protein